MKPNILLIIHYTSTCTSFITTITNGGTGKYSLICKGYEVVHQLHSRFKPCMNDQNLPLT